MPHLVGVLPGALQGGGWPQGSFLLVRFPMGLVGSIRLLQLGTALCMASDTSPPSVGNFPVCRMRDVVDQVLLGALPAPQPLILD